MLFPAMIMDFVLLVLKDALSSYGNGFRSSCLDQNFVYSWNHPLTRVFNTEVSFLKHFLQILQNFTYAKFLL
jgi:hypothetical protein